jgi:CBS domain-containing protein
MIVVLLTGPGGGHAMAPLVGDVMTRDVCMLPPSSTVTDAARVMRDQDIGDVVVAEDGILRGVVTDRDIVMRSVAEGHEGGLLLGEMLSRQLRTVSPDDTLEEAAARMRRAAVRRLVVVEEGLRVAGVLSMDDLLPQLGQGSVAAELSHRREGR